MKRSEELVNDKRQERTSQSLSLPLFSLFWLGGGLNEQGNQKEHGRGRGKKKNKINGTEERNVRKRTQQHANVKVRTHMQALLSS